MGAVLSVILVSIVAAFTYLALPALLRKKSNAKTLPGHLPLLGDFFTFLSWGERAALAEQWDQAFRQSGFDDTTQVQAIPFQRPFIRIVDPECIKHILVDKFDNYKRLVPESAERLGSRMGKLLFGNGIFSVDDELWSFQRKVAAPMFHKKSLDEMVSEFTAVGDEVIEILDAAAAEGTPIDIQRLFMRYTLDTFGKIAFGKSFKSLHDEAAAFPKHFDSALNLLVQFAVDPTWTFRSKDPYLKDVAALDSFVYDTIRSLKAEMQNETEAQRNERMNANHDLLSKFMRMRDADGKPYPDKWLRDIVLNFVIAGRDTTGLLLTWTFLELALNPDVLEKVVKEIDEVFQGENPTPEALEKTPYLDRVLKEVLRLRPSVPNTVRFAATDDVLPDGTTVPQGTMVLYSEYAVHRSDKWWNEPLKFNPDRWEDPNVLKHKFQYVPFHAGPQRCLGEMMAQKEAKAMIALVLQRFRLELDASNEVVMVSGILMTAKNGVKMFVKRK